MGNKACDVRHDNVINVYKMSKQALQLIVLAAFGAVD